MGRFNYIRYDTKAAAAQQTFKAYFETMESLVETLEPGRAKALVLTKLEEAYMWVGKAIRDQQISRLAPDEQQEEPLRGEKPLFPSASNP